MTGYVTTNISASNTELYWTHEGKLKMKMMVLGMSKLMACVKRGQLVGASCIDGLFLMRYFQSLLAKSIGPGEG